MIVGLKIVGGLLVYLLVASMIGRRLRAVRYHCSPLMADEVHPVGRSRTIPGLPSTLPQRHSGPGILVAAMKPRPRRVRTTPGL